MKTGTVTFYNGERGFGYIKPDGDIIEIFVHATALHKGGMNMLREGQRVSFGTQTDESSGKVRVESITLLQG